jgi:Xaa-Pro aminopeptidase
MTLNKFTWYVLPRSDEHQSEYLAKCDERVSFASGFTGSNAIAIVSQDEALLWTDGRYFLQAEKQLYEGWTMRKMIDTEKKWFEHISDKYQEGATIGIDSRLIAAETAQTRFKTLE